MERVKFNSQAYDLVTDGVQLTDQGGKIVLMPGSQTFDDVRTDVQTTKSITVLDSAGSPILTRTDLVYAGCLAQDDNYVVGADNEAGTDIIGTVLIAEFRTPDLREQMAAMEAKLEYMAMMSGIEMEV